jgi:flagellar basal-body rod protein FlgB
VADFSTIDKLSASLTYHRERQTVLAGNVANLDTPGYRPMDLERHLPNATSIALTTDAPGHHSPVGDEASGDLVTTFDDGGALQGADGNAVSLEREMAKIDANRTRYAANTELVSRQFAMLKYAAGDGT